MIDVTAEPITWITISHDLPLPLQALERLSWNYWWSWAADGASIFRDLDPHLWEECEHNPRLLLARTSEYRLAQMATDPKYIERVSELERHFDEYIARPLATYISPSGDIAGEISAAHPVAYFCAEYGVHNSLPLYSGGLGMLAGDHLKSASDLVCPSSPWVCSIATDTSSKDSVVTVGRRSITETLIPNELPLHQVKDEDGAPLLIECRFGNEWSERKYGVPM